MMPSSIRAGEGEEDDGSIDEHHHDDASSSAAASTASASSGPPPTAVDVDVVAANEGGGGDEDDSSTSPDVESTTTEAESSSSPPLTSSAAAPTPTNSKSRRPRPRPPPPPSFERARHVGYLTGSVVGKLPSPYSKLDTNRLTMLHFAVIGLDVLGALDDTSSVNPAIADDYKPHIVKWIYSLQHRSSKPGEIGGFKGGTYLGPAFRQGDCGVGEDDDDRRLPGRCHDHVHVAMTYSALCTLATLGDDLSRIDKRGIVNSLRALQRPDGCFRCVAPIHVSGDGDRGTPVTPPAVVEEKEEGEYDMRFLYCAAAISHILSDFSGIDVNSAVSYVRSCRSFDGAIGLLPGQEGHGGSTFCGVASLALMGRLEDVLDEDGWRDDLIAWCVRRQTTPPCPATTNGEGDFGAGDNHGGMQGRPNKADDACYSYWIGGTLRLLGRDDLLDAPRLNDFVLRCQHPMFGGFGKAIGVMPDLLHTFYSLAWLSLSSPSSSSSRPRPPRNDATVEKELTGDDDGFPPLSELDCALGMCASRTKAFSVFQ